MEDNVGKVGKNHWIRRVVPLVILVIFSVALWALHREIAHFKFADFREYLRSLTVLQKAMAVLGTILGYCALIGYDWFAVRYVKQKLSILRIAVTAFIGHAFGMNIGQSALSGGAVRMRFYTGFGLSAGEVTRIIGFNMVTAVIGQFLAAGILFTFGSITIPETVPVPFRTVRWLGIILLLVVAGFFYLLKTNRRQIKIRNWSFDLPSLKIAAPAVVMALADWVMAGVVLYFLMPQGGGIELWNFLGLVLLAQMVGAISMVPGGLGVFETALLHLLPETVDKTATLSAMIAYRAIYYLVPFILAILLLCGVELAAKKKHVSNFTGKVVGWILPVVPMLLSIMAFASGAVLLISGATPGVASRLDLLESWLPLPFIELSHFLGSIVGVALLLLSVAIRRRIDAAWWITTGLLIAGIVTSLLKGGDYEEASILGIVLVSLILCRKRFGRRASLFALRFTNGWWLMVGMVVVTVVWIGLTAYERVYYQGDLWADFGIKANAARFLRSSAGIAAALGAFAIWQLLRPGMKVAPGDELPDETERVLPIVKASRDSDAWLALLGDKRFLFSESGRSFIQYGIQNRTWIAMADVVGDPDEEEDLAWAFRELCDEAGARVAFYQVSADRAHTYAGLGLFLYKLGEEARVDLKEFSLEGSSRRNLRGTKNKMERSGATFEIVPSSQFPEIKNRLRAISEEWLEDKNAAEKSFSLGSFREDYLRHFDYALIKVDGEIVAFANVISSAEKHILSIDLMRFTKEAPPGVMESLFIELMLWGKAQGFEWFSLGMAPLSGLENRDLAPLWNRVGAQIFRLGEHFYNFKGLRSYKEKFDPVWEPRYLACRGTTQLPVVLIDTAALIGGGVVQSISGKSKKEKAKEAKTK